MQWPWKRRPPPTELTTGQRWPDEITVPVPGIPPWADLVDNTGTTAQPLAALNEPTQPLPVGGPLLTQGQRWRACGGGGRG